MNPIFYTLLCGVVLQAVLWTKRGWVALGVIVSISIYAFYTFYQKTIAKRLARDILKDVENFEVLPADFGTKRWLALGKTQNGYEVANIDLWSHEVGSKTIFPNELSLEVERCSRDEKVRNTLRNFIVPYGTIQKKDNGRLEFFFRDLAYYFTPEVNLHLAKVKLDEYGDVESIDFRERW